MLYDVIIIGGGPAGICAAIYARRAGRSVLLLERLFVGGQVTTTFEIENYPGFKSINGAKLAMSMEEQARSLDIEIKYDDIVKMSLAGEVKEVETNTEKYEAKSVILAMGAKRRELEIPGEKELMGMGVSYCAVCDGAFFRNKICAVVGGGNTALEDAIYLSKFCQKVYVVHRRDEFRAARDVQEKLLNVENIEPVYDSIPLLIEGKTAVTGLKIKNVKNEEERMLEVSGVFVAVGTVPNTDMISSEIDVDEMGYILSNEDCETNIPGVFCAGDIRRKMLRQIVTAAADGAIAATMADRFLG